MGGERTLAPFMEGTDAAQGPVPSSDAAKEPQVPPQSITRAVADLREAGQLSRLVSALAADAATGPAAARTANPWRRPDE